MSNMSVKVQPMSMLRIAHRYIIVNKPSVSVQYSFMRYKASMTKGASGSSSIICVFICVYGCACTRSTARPFVFVVYAKVHS